MPSAPVALGLGGVAALLLTSGLQGKSFGDIFHGDFGTASDPNASGDSGGNAASPSGGISTPSVMSNANAPAAIQRMIDWCNSVSGRYDYAWGGGHITIGRPNHGTCSSSGGPICNGFDCSGAVSGALGAAGLLHVPLTSGLLAGWGDAGTGRFVTIYANAVHTYMNIMGEWFGTGRLGVGGGVAWGNHDSPSGYAVRHPRGF